MRLLPARCVQPTFTYLSAYTWHRVGLDPPQTPPDHLEGPPPPLLRRRMVAGLGRKTAVQPGKGGHHALPLPGNGHPTPWPGPDEDNTRPGQGLRSARCSETGTPGAGSGPGKRAGRQGRNRAPDRLHHPCQRAMAELIAVRDWLTVFRLPPSPRAQSGRGGLVEPERSWPTSPSVTSAS